jgi:dTDP-4-dehydrorhamnose reductase
MSKQSRESVWILGAEGLLGRTWTSWLRAQGISVFGSGKEVDLASAGQVDQFLGTLSQVPSLAINCAALTGFDRCEKDPEKAFAVNADGPALLGQLAQKYGFGLIHFSSDMIFEGCSGERAEGSLPCPISTYSKSKLDGERRLQQSCPHALIIRSSWLFGHHRLNFVLRMLHAMADQPAIHLVEDQIGRPTSVLDLVRWTWQLRGQSGIWHLANDGSASWYDLAVAILELAQEMGLPIQCQEVVPIHQSQLPQIRTHSAGALLDLEKARAWGVPLRPWRGALQEVMESCLVEWGSAGLPRETR